MDDATLQRRVERIERRQGLLLILVAGAYVLAGVWVLIEETAVVTPWVAGVGVALLAAFALTVGVYRRRQAR